MHLCTFVCVHAKLLQSCLTLCDPMDSSPPGSSVHGIVQARILKWLATPSSKGSSTRRSRTQVSGISCIGRLVLYHQCCLGNPYLCITCVIVRALQSELSRFSQPLDIASLQPGLYLRLTGAGLSKNILPGPHFGPIKSKSLKVLSVLNTSDDSKVWSGLRTTSSEEEVEGVFFKRLRKEFDKDLMEVILRHIL